MYHGIAAETEEVSDSRQFIGPQAHRNRHTTQDLMKRTLLSVFVVLSLVVVSMASIGASDSGSESMSSEDNSPPDVGASATTGTQIDIGGSVSFESSATDSDGEIVDYAWYFGDGEMANGSTASTVSHTYDYGGHYWIYHVATDDAGDTGDNEVTMIDVTVFLFDPDAEGLTNDSAPYAVLLSDVDVIAQNTTVTFNMTSSYGVEWNDIFETNFASWEYIDEMTLDYGDGSAVATITPDELMTATHKYVGSGHYAAELTVTGTNGESTTVMRTIHVLNPATTITSAVKNPDAFIMVTIGEPQTLDPATDYESVGGEVLQNVYETLVFYDGDSADALVPVLAEEIPTIANGLISDDGLNYTFNIRDGVTFHDGTDLDAEDVAYSVQRALRIHDPTGPSWMIEAIMTHYISYYVGGTIQDWIDSEGVTESWLLDALPAGTGTMITESHMTDIAEAVVIADTDENTVTFRLTMPYPAFIYICAYTLMSVVSMDFVEDNGGITNGETSEFMEQNTCGTGPYMLKTWDVGSKIVLTRNDDYWGDAPALKDIYIVKANDVNTRILMLQAGDADSIYLPIDYEDLFATEDYRIIKGLPTFNMMFAGFNFDINTEDAAVYGSDVPSDFFHDVHVRRAFTHLMDYDLFLENVLDGNGIQPNGVIPKGMFGYDENVPKYEHSLELAQQEFELAINDDTGNSWYEDGFEIALIYNAGNTYRQTACELMKDTLEDMGSQFTMNVVALDWPTYLTELRKAPAAFPMFWLGWAPDYADPDNYMTPFLDSVFGIYPYTTGYANTTIDDIIREAAAELDPDTRAELYSEASMLVYEDAPYIWMYQANNFHIERSWVEGYFFNPMFSGLYYAALSKTGGPPVADAGADQTVTVGDDVTFDGSGSSDDGTIENYTWTFTYDDDMWTLYGIDPTFTFDIAETYIATLNVTDDDGQTDEDTVIITVEDLPAVGPTADAGPDQTVTVGDDVTFDGSGSSDDGTIENYTWTFTYDDEAQTLYGVDPTFTFDTTGAFDVTLIVTDDNGLTDEDTMKVTVSPGDDKTFTETYGLALGVAAALVVAALALFFLMKGGKKSSGTDQGSAEEHEEP